MTDRKADRRKEARDHALATGGYPIDPYPGYLNWFFRECVEVGAASGLDWICHEYPEREIEIIETWCRLAIGHPWAWHEARSRLEGLVVREEGVPPPLARFAIEHPPPSTRGPDPEGSRNVVLECMVRRLQAEGFDQHGVNSQFDESFPSPGRKDPGSTLRKRRKKARPFVAPVFEPHEDDEGDPQKFRRKVVLEYDWSEPRDAMEVLLTSGWPAFALIWELWPENREEHLALWCERAPTKSWVWDELRRLFDHAVYCGWSLPPLLRDFVALARPENPSHRPVKHGLWLRAAAIEARLAQVVHSQRAARRMLLSAFNVNAVRSLKDEARSRLEGLVVREEEVPPPLARFAIERPPPSTRGPDPEGSRTILLECMVRRLQAEGFDQHGVNSQFDESFPSPGRKDPGSTLRKRRKKARPFVAPVFEPHEDNEGDSKKCRRKVVLEYDWSEPRDAMEVLLRSGWPAFALIWELWPEHREEHLALWCEQATTETWVWDELRGLFDHAVYCGWSLPPLLRDFVALARPENPSHRPVKPGQSLRAAAIEARLAQVVHSQRAARRMLLAAFNVNAVRSLKDRAEYVGQARAAIEHGKSVSAAPSPSPQALATFGVDLESSTIRKQIISGRERLSGVIALLFR